MVNRKFVDDFLEYVKKKNIISTISSKNLRFSNKMHGILNLTKKHLMAISIVKHCSKMGLDSSGIIPDTYIIVKETWKSDLKNFQNKVDTDAI